MAAEATDTTTTTDAPAETTTDVAPAETTTATVTADEIEALGLDPADVSPTDPAITGVPRDERHDSIDAGAGVLTQEAVSLRAERGIHEAGLQADDKPE